MNNRVLNNAVWIIACKAAQSILQLLIGMFTARYLGPSNYGLINYAASIVAFALPVMKLGFSGTLVYELMQDPDKEGEVLGTSLVLNILSSLVCMAGVYGFVTLSNPGNREIVLVCCAYSLSLFFAALEMIQYWYQAQLQSKYCAVIMLASYVIVSAYKIFLLVTQRSIIWFAFIHSIEYGIIAAALIYWYFRLSGARLTFSLRRAKDLLGRSRHYILSALMVVVIQNTDHVMLTEMLGTVENGMYTAAITSAGVVQFVYTAVIDSFRPLILGSRGDRVKFERSLTSLYSLIIYVSLAQSLVFSLLAKLIISILYGANYAGAVPVLRILTWYCAFSFIGSVRNIWILAEGKQKYLWIINLSGAAFNVVLNLLAIPLWGARGAALASLLTQIFTNYILSYFLPPLRRNNDFIIRALNPKLFVEECRATAALLLRRL